MGSSPCETSGPKRQSEQQRLAELHVKASRIVAWAQEQVERVLSVAPYNRHFMVSAFMIINGTTGSPIGRYLTETLQVAATMSGELLTRLP
jgi:hypothetical protein